MHEHLEHAPQAVLILTLLTLVAAATEQGLAARFDTLPYLAPLVFAAQEHLERYVHTGHVPFLLTDRTFLLGLALQAPLALLVARLSRPVVRAIGGRSRGARPRPLWILAAGPAPPKARPGAPLDTIDRPARGPP